MELRAAWLPEGEPGVKVICPVKIFWWLCLLPATLGLPCPNPPVHWGGECGGMGGCWGNGRLLGNGHLCWHGRLWQHRRLGDWWLWWHSQPGRGPHGVAGEAQGSPAARQPPPGTSGAWAHLCGTRKLPKCNQMCSSTHDYFNELKRKGFACLGQAQSPLHNPCSGSSGYPCFRGSCCAFISSFT